MQNKEWEGTVVVPPLYAEKRTYLKARYLSALLVYVDNWKGCTSYIGCDACSQVPDEARMNMHQASYNSGHILEKNQRAASPKKRGHIFFNFKGHIFFSCYSYADA